MENQCSDVTETARSLIQMFSIYHDEWNVETIFHIVAKYINQYVIVMSSMHCVSLKYAIPTPWEMHEQMVSEVKRLRGDNEKRERAEM